MSAYARSPEDCKREYPAEHLQAQDACSLADRAHTLGPPAFFLRPLTSWFSGNIRGQGKGLSVSMMFVYLLLRTREKEEEDEWVKRKESG